MTPALDDLVRRVRRLGLGRRRVLLGVCGAPGGGKSTLAAALVAELSGRDGVAAVQVPMDGFHLADEELSRLRLLGRKGAPETFDAWGYVSLLARLRAAEEPVTYAPGFERTLEQALAGVIPVPRETRVVVTEGNYLLLEEPPWDRVGRLLDEVWFCAVDDDVRRERLVARHIAFGKSKAEARTWVAEVDEPNALLVARTRERADVVVDMAEPDVAPRGRGLGHAGSSASGPRHS